MIARLGVAFVLPKGIGVIRVAALQVGRSRARYLMGCRGYPSSVNALNQALRGPIGVAVLLLHEFGTNLEMSPAVKASRGPASLGNLAVVRP